MLATRRAVKIDQETEQVAQLWQKDRAKLASFSITVQLYSLNHKIAFLSHPTGASEAIDYKRFI